MNLFNLEGDAIEWIHIELTGDMEKFLVGDYIWTDDHNKLPFYRKKYIYLNPENPNLFQCTLYWRSYEEWKSIHNTQAENYERYNNLVGHLIVSQVDVTQGFQFHKIFERAADDSVLPQPLLIYELEAVTEDKFQQLLTKFNNPMELWRKKENAHYLVVTGDIEKDKVLHEYLQNELSAKLAHKLVKTHYFPPVTTQ